MSASQASETIRIPPAGPVQGVQEDDVLVFRGIPYAQPPVGEGRFAPPRPRPAWQAVRDCTRPASIAPQLPSRLRSLIGDVEGVQSEDCLSLTVWAPACESSSPRAVMVWLHGGAYMTGAGAQACYSGNALARRGDVIVVSPNFRLGALGFLHLPGVSEGNLGLLDIALALQWVQENIAAFGGDPSRVTVFGQSSGASCVRALMSMPAAQGLFQRAVLQSAALGRGDRTPEFATGIGLRYARALGLDPADRQGWIEADVDRLLAAQGQVARSFEMPLGMSQLPFTPVLDGVAVQDEAHYNWFAREGGALIVGFNAQEMTAWHSMDPAVQQATREQALASMTQWLGRSGDDACERLAGAHEGEPPAAALCDFYTDELFGRPSLEFAQRMAVRGVRTWAYRFEWQASGGLQACHCLELPFVFNNLPQWTGASMLKAVDAAAFESVANGMQGSWTAFARNGDPNPEGISVWRLYSTEGTVMNWGAAQETDP